MAKKLNLIKEKLDQQGKSIYWLAEQTGMSYSSLHKYATGKADPKLTTLEKIAKAMKVGICDLIKC
jgi:DNA-binding Xre family transcriptional regulator